MSVGSIGRALAHRNFRLFFFGQSISLIGTWMQQIAMVWLVYRLTNSAVLLGVVGFAAQVPIAVLAPFAGVLTDRWNRHRTLLLTQTLAMLQALAMMGLAMSGLTVVWPIVVLSVFLGCVNALDMPTRQAFLAEMVDSKENLANAIALNSSMFNAARLIGPSIAGFVIGLVGEGVCFFLNAVSYLAVLAALLAMRLPPQKAAAPQTEVLHGLREGLRYAFGFPPIRAILLILTLISFGGMPLMILLPVFATDVLHGGPDTFGLLQAASGVGALVSAILLASRKTVLGLGRLIAVTAALFGVGMIGFAFSTRLWLSMLLLLVTGFATVFLMAACNTILQTIVEEDKRGRVMSLYTLAFLGTAPPGSLLSGVLARSIGAPATVMLGGAACLVGALVFARQLPQVREHVRPIYRRAGILPEVSKGLQSATEMTIPPED